MSLCPEAVMNLYGGGELEEYQQAHPNTQNPNTQNPNTQNLDTQAADSSSSEGRVEQFCFDQKAIVDILSVWLARERGMALPVKRQGRLLIERNEQGQPAQVMLELRIEPVPNVTQLPRKPGR